MRQFVSITQEEIDAKFAESLKAREMELLSYDFEKEAHEQVIQSLGDISWTPENEQYRGMARDKMIEKAMKNGLTEEQIAHIANLLLLDQHKHNLMAVKVETAKSERHYDNVLQKLPAGSRREAALAKLSAK